MEPDPELELWKKRWLALAEVDLDKAIDIAGQEYREYLARKKQREKIQKRVMFVARITLTFIFGYIFDRVGVALGLFPEEWLLGNMVRNLWHRIFG